MSDVKKIFFVGPTYAALSGDRRKAFMRHWKLSASIFAVSVVLIVIVLAMHLSPVIVEWVIVALLTLQLLYALIRGETIWQLRIKELNYRSQAQKANKEDLFAYAERLKRGNA